jgi:hypothetical protein
MASMKRILRDFIRPKVEDVLFATTLFQYLPKEQDQLQSTMTMKQALCAGCYAPDATLL